MKKFLKRIFIFILPLVLFFLIIVGTFYFLDPFKILKHYDEFKNSIVAYNEDYVATERYLEKKTHYNSFVFGSSRAGCGFMSESWEKYLQKTDSAYSFAASNESIFGIVGKVRLIDKENERLDNALVILDTDETFKRFTNSSGHLFIKHPLISNDSRHNFISEYLKDYIFKGFFVPYLDYKLFRSKRGYMHGFLTLDVDTSERYIAFNVKHKESLIEANSKLYYDERKNVFYKRNLNESVLGRQILSQGIEDLKDIKRIFDKHHSKYKIVISPLYDQEKLNPKDMDILIQIFGVGNVYDFSGKNFITKDETNYYETSHYRREVGNKILSMIYPAK
jgi:hypothetical protein